MTRKHFNALANKMNNTKPYGDCPELKNQWLQDCYAIASVCKQFNGNFDTDKFIATCKGE